jgi:hypothetical protein
MARPRGPIFHIRPLVELLGLDEIIRQLGPRNVLQAYIKYLGGIDKWVDTLTPAQCEQLRKQLAKETAPKQDRRPAKKKRKIAPSRLRKAPRAT